MVKRSKSSDRWLQRQRKDQFVRKAQDGGQISRAHFKLAQIDQRYKLVKPNRRVLELGAAPGGWTNYLEERLGAGLLIAIDPLPITCGDRTHVIEGYAGESAVDDEIERILAGQKLDLVLSDMAPNISGVRAVDQARAMDLADISLDSCHRWMNQRGAMAIKAFQGEGLDDWVKDLKKIFKQVHMTKPKASRPESREVFVVAIDFLPE
ncbi:MAG: 23S rRNA (uridine2552-2'-O)-methyltransferase [Candidatus Azotimanducaceae bacterium]|jgi:23S rRNA (uridine2552-2'-O)-methyltransferase|tara:strand:+ start:1371 stop:1994 length:624 start_codon:yes stop_codon:yes gene_type:complete